MPAGRPTDYNQELADRIVERICEGQSIRKLCESEDMPSRASIARWQAAHPEFDAKCARARELQGDYWAEKSIECVEAANSAEDAQVAKVRVSAYQWYASKLNRRYGDKVEHSGTVTQIVADASKFKDLPQEDLEAAVAMAEKLAEAVQAKS